MTPYFIIKDFQTLPLYLVQFTEASSVEAKNSQLADPWLIAATNSTESLWGFWELWLNNKYIAQVCLHLSCHRLHMGRCWNSSEQLTSHTKERWKAQTRKDLLNNCVGYFSLPMNADLSCANQQQTLRSYWVEVKQQCIYSLSCDQLSNLNLTQQGNVPRGKRVL